MSERTDSVAPAEVSTPIPRKSTESTVLKVGRVLGDAASYLRDLSDEDLAMLGERQRCYRVELNRALGAEDDDATHHARRRLRIESVLLCGVVSLIVATEMLEHERGRSL